MAITYTWSVSALDSTVSDGKVNTVHWSVIATDGTHSANSYGSVGLTGDLTIPYADITKDIAIGWAKDALNAAEEVDEDGNDAVTNIEAGLANQIAELANPTCQCGVPW
jgi:hypothetical protein